MSYLGRDGIILYRVHITSTYDDINNIDMSEVIFEEDWRCYQHEIGRIRCNMSDTDKIKDLIVKSCDIITIEDENEKSSGFENYESKVIIPGINTIIKSINDNHIKDVDFYIEMPGYPDGYTSFHVTNIEPNKIIKNHGTNKLTNRK